MKVKQLWKRRQENYKGLEIKCPIGAHTAAFNLLSNQSIKCSSVLDLGSGSGAFLKRLQDEGFTNLHAVELDVESFQILGVELKRIDLNTNFSNHFPGKFGLVTALEIIEHLENPRAFIREISKLLESKGYLLLSTPNVSNWLGRIQFFFSGKLRYFDETQYSQRHISPIVDLQMRQIFQENGLQLLENCSAGSFWGPLRYLVALPIRSIFFIFFGKKILGDTNIYLLVKD